MFSKKINGSGSIVPIHGRDNKVNIVAQQPRSTVPSSSPTSTALSTSDPVPPNMEDSVIILPMLEDSVVTIGDLWDCSNNVCPGNLFGKPFEVGHLEAFPMQMQDYTLHMSKNTSDKLNTLEVSAELKLEIGLGGEGSQDKLKIAGSVNYETKDSKKFNEEELMCTYSKSTYVVRVRPTAAALIDPIILEKLGNKTMRATHFVQSVRIGGQATASIRVSQNIEQSDMTVSGKFDMDLVTGKVDVKAKAEMKMLDNELKEEYRTTVNVKARPGLRKSPTNCAQMFNEIEMIDTYVLEEKHFPTITDKEVYGVPLAFKLVPLSQFIDYEAEALYKMLSDDLMNEFTSMVFKCQDFQTPSYIKGLIRERDPRLVTILSDLSNPYTKKIVALEEDCNKKAREVKSKAFTVFSAYKNDKLGNTAAIVELIAWYDSYFGVIEIMARIQDLVDEGKQELNGIHAGDVVELGAPPRFFSNKVDLDDWWTSERTIKLLLQTNNETASPSGTFLRLFGLAGPLAKLGVEIGIAFPNISEDFSLTFKIWDKEVPYKGKNIVFALEVLAVAVESGDMMSSLFYVLNGILSGLDMTSVAENLPDVTSLVKIFKESHGVKICETYPQLLETLLVSKDTWNFVIPLQGTNCSIEMMKFFRQLREELPKAYPKVKHQWIVGRFNLDLQDSPLLFVFRETELCGICLDHLDILILLHQLRLSPTTPDLSILSHENIKVSCLYPSRANFALKIIEGLVLDHKTTLTDLVPPLDDVFPYTPPANIATALKVTRACALRKELDVLNTIAFLALEDIPILISTFLKYSWTDAGFETLDPEVINWEDLYAELTSTLGTQAPYLAKVVGALLVLRKLEVPTSGDPEEILKLKEKITEVVEFLNSKTPSSSRTYKYKGMTISEDDKFKDLKIIVGTFEVSEVSMMLRGILNAFENFLSEELAAPAYFNYSMLLFLISELAKEEHTFAPMMVDVSKLYCDQALASINKENYKDAEKKIRDSIKERNLFKTMGVLSSLNQHHYIYTLTEILYNLTTLTSIEPMKYMIEYMRGKEFTTKQYEAFWSNPKFLFLIRQGIDNAALVKTIFVELCIEGDEVTSVPSFIPRDIAERLKPLFFSMVEPAFNWPKVWKDVDVIIQAFQIIVTRKYIPALFPRVLRDTLETREEIFKIFKDLGALFYWDVDGKYFVHPWSLRTIEVVLQILMDNPPPKEPSSSARVQWTPRNKNQVPDTKNKLPEVQVPVAGGKTQTYTELEQFDPTTALTLPVNETWKRFTIGGYFDKILGSALVTIQKLKGAPLVEYDELNKTFNSILPYLVQQARIHNSASLMPSMVVDYIKYPLTDGRPRPGFIDFDASKRNEAERFLMSKADLLTALLNLSDPLVIHHMLCSMLKAPLALPLIVPGVVDTPSAGFKFIFPALQNLTIPELEGIVPNPHLLASPFRFVLALRVGDTAPLPGKSMVINQLLMSHEHMFSCLPEPGVRNGKPVARPGLVEFTWLGKSKTNAGFYDSVLKEHYGSNQPDMVLLANLHGDALNFQPTLDLLKTFTSSFVVFWKATNWSDLRAKKAELSKLIGSGSNVLDLVLYPDASIVDHVDEQNIIRMEPDEIENSREKLQNILREAIASKSKIPAPLLQLQRQRSSPGVDESGDPGILNFIRGRKTKGELSKFKLSEIEEDGIACGESERLLDFIRQVSVQKVKEALTATKIEDLPILEALTQLVMDILELPLVQRNMAWTHFAYELEYLSRRSSLLAVERLLKLRTELEAVQNTLDETELAELQNDVKAVLGRIQVTTLTQQDIWRYLINQPPLENALAGKYPEYFTSGFGIELFQPTWGEVMWDKSMKDAFASIPPTTRVFVISALGLKAGGKSSLLNRLFGAEFREGPAGCTHGLQMRFLWVDANLKKEINCDAFLVIDSEGLGAPENVVDESADLLERNIASFILGISHLTLTNVLGESMMELRDVLETAFTTLTRVNDMILAPDMLLIQQQVPTETPPIVGSLVDEWSGFMQNVRSLTRENELAVGVRVREAYRTETVRQRLKHAELTHVIRPITDNAEQNSIQYQADIQSLYVRIIELCQRSSQILPLGDWYEFTQKYWQNIKSLSTSLDATNNLKNTIKVKETILLEDQVRGVKSAIDLAFRSHEKDYISEEFDTQLDEHLSEEDSRNQNEPFVDPNLIAILQAVDAELDSVINSCTKGMDGAPCSHCLNAFSLREALFEATHGRKRQFLFVDKINDYMARVRGSIWSRYKQRVIARQLDTGIIKEGKRDELHDVWKELDEEYTGNNPTAWMKYRQFISTIQTVIPASQLIDEEFRAEYASLPHILDRISEEHELPDLEKLIAFDLGHYNSAVESALNSPKRETLTWDKNDWIVAKIEDLPAILLTDSDNSEVYLVGMMRELKEKMNQLLVTFQTICGEQLAPNFKWEAHLYAAKTVRAFMGKKQEEWDQKNNPLTILARRKQEVSFSDLFHVVEV